MSSHDDGPVLHTERLILRPPAVADLDGWATLMGDKDAMRYLAGPQPRPLAWRNLMMMAGSWALCGFGMFSVIDKASGEWLGRIGPWHPDGWPGAELGWALLPRAQGKGLAAEAAGTCLRFCFETLGWSDVVHCIDCATTRRSRLPSASDHAAAVRAPCPRLMTASRSVCGDRRAPNGALRLLGPRFERVADAGEDLVGRRVFALAGKRRLGVARMLLTFVPAAARSALAVACPAVSGGAAMPAALAAWPPPRRARAAWSGRA